MSQAAYKLGIVQRNVTVREGATSQQILSVARSALDGNNCIITFETGPWKINDEGDEDRYYIKAIVMFTDADTGQEISVSATAPEGPGDVEEAKALALRNLLLV